VVESTKTDSVSVYAVPYTTGYVDNDWNIKFNFYNTQVEGSSFVGSSGTNYDTDYVYFVDQKPSNRETNSVDIIYAAFDSKNLNDPDLEKKGLTKLLKKHDQGYLNLPSSAQIVKSIFNTASSIRITSNGISVEGNNTTVGKLSGQLVYPFDIYPIKWSNTQIPFVLNFKDDSNYTVKTYGNISKYHTGQYNNTLNDLNLKLVKFVELDPLQTSNGNLSVIELKDAVFEKNKAVPEYNNSPYFAGKVSIPYESKTVAISATIKIQDEPAYKSFPIYGFLSQIGVPKIKKYEKVKIFDYCDTNELDFYYNQKFSTFSDTTTANVHICFSPVKFLDESKENRVFVLDADNEKIFKTDTNGNVLSIINLKSAKYLRDAFSSPIETSFVNHYGAASPMWCTTDRNGNAYVSLTDNISAIKIDYGTDIISRVYYPPFENLELYDPDLYVRKNKKLVTINGAKNIVPIQYNQNHIVTIQKFSKYSGFVGENTILPSCLDVDKNDNLYIAYTHPLSNFICKYSNDGTLLNTILFNTYEVPQEIIIDSQNNLWVGVENIAESAASNLERNDIVYFIDGNTLQKTVIRGIRGLGMMTIDEKQNIFVLNKTNTITKIDATTKTKKDYIIGESINEDNYLKDIGAIGGNSSGELWVASNVDGKLYFLDTENLEKPISEVPYEMLKDLTLTTIQNIQSIYLTMGDWTGFRWINKFLTTTIPEPRIISGLSTYFDILEPNPTVAKYGEEFDYLTQIKSYILQESLFDKKVLLDDFVGQILGKDEKIDEIGKVIYEKISNFVANNSDIDTCNIQQLMSFADETGTDLNEYLYSYPPSVRRALDILSICHRRLFGSINTYNQNFGLSAYKYFDNNNLGSEIDIDNGTFIAGQPIVSYELFSEKYDLKTNTIIPNYNIGDVVPMSAVNYNWGWGLITGTREQSGSEIKDYYKFYNYVPVKNPKIYDNIINFDSKFTTLTPYQSSYKDWSKFGGYMDRILSYGLYKGLKILN